MRALIITGALVQDQEFIYPFYRLQEAGYDVHVATPERKDVLGYFGTKIEANDDTDDIDVRDFDLLILPGGVKCMEKIRQEGEIIDFIKKFHYAGKVIGSICSAAQLLISAKIVKGNRISGYYAMKDDINNSGAEFADCNFIVSDRIVTSPHYKFLGQWMGAVLKEVEAWKQSSSVEAKE